MRMLQNAKAIDKGINVHILVNILYFHPELSFSKSLERRIRRSCLFKI